MGDKLLDKIIDFICAPYYKVDFLLAKRWLDRNFGKQEYWGDYIQNLISKP